MDDKSKLGVRQYFRYDPLNHMQKCLVENCEKSISGNNKSNMIRHIETNHKEFFVKKNIGRLKMSREEFRSKAVTRRNVQQWQYDRRIEEHGNVDKSQDLVWEGCMELVTQVGFPCNFISSSAFRKILTPIKSHVIFDTQLTIDNLKFKITEASYDIRNRIQTDCKNIMLSLKIDSAHYLGRAIFGVNIQYINNDSDLITRALGIKDLKIDDTSEYLSSLIMGVLTEYNINLEQIYSITIDNDDNIVKTPKFLKQLDNSNTITESNHHKMDFEDSVSNSESITFDEVDTDFDYENCDQIIFDNLIQAGSEILKNATQSFNNDIISEIQHGSHTIDVMIEDILSQPDIQFKIQEVRNIVTILQDPQHLMKLQIDCLKKPIIDNPSRCSSTLDMIERLLELKEFFFEQKAIFPELNEVDADWDFLVEFTVAFQPVRNILLKLQCDQTVYSNFYKYWLELKFELQKISSSLSELLNTWIEEKEKIILNNPVLVSAIYLDPRFKFLLNPAQNELARIHLKALYDHTQKFNQKPFEISNIKQEKEEIIASPSASSDLADYLKILEAKQKQENPTDIDQHKAYYEIENFHQTRLEPHTNIMEYWTMRRDEYPSLYNLAKIVNATPASQISVDKVFSALKYIINDNGLTDEEFLQNILLVRLNSSS